MKRGRDSLVANVFFSGLSWLSNVSFLIVLILAARGLGDVVYGQFAFAFAVVALFEVATDLGLRDYLVREVARAPDQTGQFLGTALFVKAWLSIGTLLVLHVVALQITSGADVRLAIDMLALAMVCRSFKLIFRSILVGHERFQREALIVNIDRAVVLVACGTAIALGVGLIGFTAAFMGAGVANVVLTVLMTDSPLRRPAWPDRWAESWKIIRPALPFGLSVAAFAVYFRVDSVMLALMRGDAEVGWYNAAYRLTEGLIVVPMVLQYALMPRMSVLHVEDSAAVPALVRRTSKYLIAVALPMTVFGIVAADRIVDLVYGVEYAPAGDALAILLLGLGFMFLWSIFTAVLNATNRPHIPLIGVSLGSALNVVVNFFLIPVWGYLGACVATVVAEVFLFLFLLRELVRSGFGLELLRSLARPILALVPGTLVMVFVAPWSVVAATLLAGVLYSAVILMSGFLDEPEMEALAHVKEKLLLWWAQRGSESSS